jgi:hypothetical protein
MLIYRLGDEQQARWRPHSEMQSRPIDIIINRYTPEGYMSMCRLCQRYNAAETQATADHYFMFKESLNTNKY